MRACETAWGRSRCVVTRRGWFSWRGVARGGEAAVRALPARGHAEDWRWRRGVREGGGGGVGAPEARRPWGRCRVGAPEPGRQRPAPHDQIQEAETASGIFKIVNFVFKWMNRSFKLGIYEVVTVMSAFHVESGNDNIMWSSNLCAFYTYYYWKSPILQISSFSA